MSDPRCLHCALLDAVDAWAKENAPRDERGAIVVDVSLVVCRTAEVIAEYTHKVPEGPQRERFERYARECLQGALDYQQTGVAIPVIFPALGRRH